MNGHHAGDVNFVPDKIVHSPKVDTLHDGN